MITQLSNYCHGNVASEFNVVGLLGGSARHESVLGFLTSTLAYRTMFIIKQCKDSGCPSRRSPARG
jgi:hypothetical protein